MNQPQENPSFGPGTGWSPLLTGVDARHAWEAIEAIARDLSVWPDELEPHPALGGGTGGLALFFAYLAEATGEERYADRAIGYLEDMISAWESRPPYLSLYSGMTGSAFVLEHLRGRLFDADDPSNVVAELVEAVLDRPTRIGEYDLINGLVGLGVYGLEMWPRSAGRRCLELVLQHLEATAEERDGGVTWFTPRESVPEHQWTEFPDGYYNLGMAHGVPAIVALLGAMSARGIAPARVRRLLDGAVDWLLRQRTDCEAGAWFPHATAPGVSSRKSRLAWCYGDPGVAAALLGGALAAGEPGWQQTARELARNCARRSLDGAGTRDAGLCHGSSGLGLLFSRFFDVWGDGVFAAAATGWYRQALRMRQPGRGIGGYLSFVGVGPEETRWRPTRGFLEGAAGVGLALLAGVSPVEPAWDRVMMTSLRPLNDEASASSAADARQAAATDPSPAGVRG